MTKLYRKLGVHTRMQAIGRAASLGYISIGMAGRPGAESPVNGA